MSDHLVIDWPRGKNNPRCLSIASDIYLPGLVELVEDVHAGGAAVAAQLNYSGGQTTLDFTQGIEPIAPSAIAVRAGTTVPRAMTKLEIAHVIEFFAKAADRAVRAGFDLVEIHAVHGYLLGQFLSPRMNLRGDEYGGSLDNRARLLVEVYRAVRGTVGPDFPMLCRLNISDFEDGGLTSDDVRQIVSVLDREGIDAVDFSGGINSEWTFPSLSSNWPSRDLVSQAREATAKPVVAAGKLTPQQANDAIQLGTIDFAAFGRGFLADSEWPLKLVTGRQEEVRPCIYCNQCLLTIRTPAGLSCTVNPSTGREYRARKLGGLEAGGRAIVVGGGPAGIEIALRLSTRNWKVTLHEKASALGGQLRLALACHLFSDFKPLLVYYEKRLRQLGVELRLASELAEDALNRLDTDLVVLATGGTVQKPEIEGTGSVISGLSVLEPGSQSLSDAEVVVVGSGLLACGVAARASADGATVTLLSPEPLLAQVERTRRKSVLDALERARVHLLASARPVRWGWTTARVYR